MINVRKSTERGRADFGWLESNHSFSFGHYYDAKHMGWGPLRVINEDRVIAGAGFDPHPHRDMEIISYVIDGALEHKDSIGNGSVIRPGRLQRMSAGTGIRHSEYNGSQTNPVHFLQIWIIPEKQGIEPGYEEKDIAAPSNDLQLIGSRTGRDGSITIHQDVDLYAAHLTAGSKVNHSLKAGRLAWLQVVSGTLTLGDTTLDAGDGAAIADEDILKLHAQTDIEALLFDMVP
ncbi:pirin family protein [uncultured Thalassospira sp.]|jgi:redox-sensitive bicupin YhaK (pirin superfamily)|uniref:pirin family protein n=1 Tax=uncultured Thalassospira sp. TaxID=404382 RepID=UPI0030D960B7|tara:strand:- start:8343 stop:9038 length:696 start_codon:yes stop_codon:yes gene_type:complete